MSDNNRIATLLALKGAPLSVLIAISFEPTATHAHLSAITGWSKNVVTDATTRLRALQLIQKSHRYGHYTITPKGQHFLSGIPNNGTPDEESIIVAHENLSSTYCNNNKYPPILWDSHNPNSTAAALSSYNVLPNRRSIAIAQRDDITPDVINTIATDLITRYGCVEPGLLITILDAYRPDTTPTRPNYHKYKSGKYGDIGE